jgi:hypothetical protein
MHGELKKEVILDTFKQYPATIQIDAQQSRCAAELLKNASFCIFYHSFDTI